MLKQNYFMKKQLSILLIGIICITSIISGYTTEKLQDDSVKARTVTSISGISKDAAGKIISGRWRCNNGVMIELVDNKFNHK